MSTARLNFDSTDAGMQHSTSAVTNITDQRNPSDRRANRQQLAHGIDAELLTCVERDLAKQQVAHVKSLYSADEIDTVKQLLAGYFDSGQQSTGTSHTFRTLDKNGRILELERACQIDQAFRQTAVYQRSYELASAVYDRPCHYGFDHAIFKKPGSGSVAWHQDQFYSKGDLHKQCLSFWIPLQDVTAENGGMEYDTGRHSLLPHTPVSKGSHTHHIEAAHLPDTRRINPEMNKGDTCIHTPMTLHRSHPNNGTQTRGAWILQFNRYGCSRFIKWRNVKSHWLRIKTRCG